MKTDDICSADTNYLHYSCKFLAGPLYMVWSPIVNVVYHFLVFLMGKDQVNNKDHNPSTFIVIPFLNLFEVIFEAFPQVRYMEL